MRFEFKSAVLPLVFINAAIFIVQISLGGVFTNSFLLNSDYVFTRPWILVTHMFLHSSPYHLLFNMWALFLFGTLLEQKIGAKRFIALYTVSGLIAGFASSFFYSRSLGASGAVMGVIGALIILMPDLKLLMFYVIPMPLWLAGIFYAIIDIWGVFFPAGVGNIAHLVGMACGLAYGMKLRKEKRKFHKKFASKSHLEEDDIDEYLKTGRI